MTDISDNNRRIARNTAFLYVRMFFSMAVSLYSSRVVLQTLGIEDYGVYNIVGGVVAMFSFISSTMSSATSRFLTYEIGRGCINKLKDTFNASFWVHVIISAIVFILCETVGLWFLKCEMVIPEGRESAANIVFQISILSTIISILQVPYNAILIAHEKMDIYAYVEMVNVFLKLGILYLLVLLEMDKLILYGILMLVVNSSIAAFYCMYARKHYSETQLKAEWNWKIIKPLLSFSGWDTYGNMAVVARTQGVGMLLNVFFGPVMNAAAGIAASVQSAVMSFANNVNTAVRPQIIKYFAVGEYKQMESLINNACKLNFLILAIIIVPLCAEIDYVLRLWLTEVPEMAGTFCVLTLAFNLVSNMSFLVNIGNHAAGKIFRPSIINGTLYMMVLPVTYFSFKMGGSAWTSYLFNLCAVAIGMFSNAYTLHLNVPEYSVAGFIRNVLSKCMIILGIGFLASYGIRLLFEPSFSRFLMTVAVTTALMGWFGWRVMLPENLQKLILTKMGTVICRKA